METKIQPTPRSKPRPFAYRIIPFLLIAVFFVLTFLLAQTMVHHRFFRGQRMHPNGSVGQ